MSATKPVPLSVSKSVYSDGSVIVTVTYENYLKEVYPMRFKMKNELEADNYIERQILPHIPKRS